MDNTRAKTRRDDKGDEEQKDPLQAPPQDPIDLGPMTNVETRSALQILTQAMMAQVNKEVISPANNVKSPC